MTRYNRQDVLRILHIDPASLLYWEQERMIDPKDEYFLDDMVLLMQLQKFGPSKRLATRAAMKACSGTADGVNPMRYATVVRTGNGFALRREGALINPATQQLAFDFEADSQARVFGGDGNTQRSRDELMHTLFLEAVQLEEHSSTLRDATEIYQRILEMNPRHAPACINLGTIFYNQRQYIRAEQLYRRATESDPHYALAFFDLGNVLDELKRLKEAIEAYRRAIQLVPGYADAHYNLALAYERQGQRRKALQHWMRYVKLDPSGPWSNHARGQAQKILGLEKLKIVHRRGIRLTTHSFSA